MINRWKGGDIVAIRNSSGNIVATYEYDAWGNVTVKGEYGIINTNSTFIDNINPFRYRGYYYDTETGFYYLQSRYYDPTICRFINADNYELISELSSVAGQLNMYAYCNNNPIMYTDESGEGILTAILIGALIGAIVGGTVSGINAANNGETGWDLVGSIAQGVLIGGGIGGIGGAIVGAIPTIGAFMGSTFTFSSGAMAISVSGAQIAAGAAIGALGMYTFASTNRPHDNRRQNEQYKEIMHRLGYKKTDWQWRYGHDHLPKESLGFKQLLEFLRNLFKNV